MSGEYFRLALMIALSALLIAAAVTDLRTRMQMLEGHDDLAAQDILLEAGVPQLFPVTSAEFTYKIEAGKPQERLKFNNVPMTGDLPLEADALKKVIIKKP